MMILVFGTLAGNAQITFAQLITQVDRQGGLGPPPQIFQPFGEFAQCYVDRTHLYADLPPELPELVGAEYILTADNDKNVDDVTIDVTFSATATVFLILDNRIGGTAGGKGVDPILDDELTWVTALGFVDTGFDIGIDEWGDGYVDQYSSIFAASLPAGTHTFGEQHDGVLRNMYGIVAVPSGSEPIAATIKIEPEVINRKSQGRWIICYLQLPVDYSVFDIDFQNIFLEGDIPASKIEIDNTSAELTIMFPREEVHPRLIPGAFTLMVSGFLLDGTAFEGSDTVRVIN
jgi:hypothetical protein